MPTVPFQEPHNRRPGPTAARPASSFAAPFGVPLGDLGWFATLVMSIAMAFASFFVATFIGIVSLLIISAATHHPVDYALSYRRIGLPVGIVVGILAFSYLGLLWTRRITRRA